MDIAAESDESRSLVRVAIWAGQNAHDPGLYLLYDSIYPGLYSEEAFIRGNTVHTCIHLLAIVYILHTRTVRVKNYGGPLGPCSLQSCSLQSCDLYRARFKVAICTVLASNLQIVPCSLQTCRLYRAQFKIADCHLR